MTKMPKHFCNSNSNSMASQSRLHRVCDFAAKVSDFLETAHGGNLTRLKRLAREFDNGNGLAKVFGNLKDLDGKTALHHAASGGNCEICEYLVKKLKIDVDLRDEKGCTPLHLAAEHHQPLTVPCLIRLGADIGSADSNGVTALHYAARSGNAEIMEFLISKGAGVDVMSRRYGTPLHMAASGGKIEAVKVLLSHKANLNSILHHFFTPLMMSIVGESFECAELLLKGGADPNIGSCGVTPLSYAVNMPDAGWIKCLLKYGANPNNANGSSDSDLTALELAALGDNRKIMRILFPVTARIEGYADWTINGIVDQIRSVEATQERVSRNFAAWKEKGKEAFQREDYLNAVFWYTQGINMSPYDETLFSNRSLCWARLNEGHQALFDADACAKLRPDWSKAHYRRGAALKILKEYDLAVQALRNALDLDPRNKEIEKEYREVLEMAEKVQNAQQSLF